MVVESTNGGRDVVDIKKPEAKSGPSSFSTHTGQLDGAHAERYMTRNGSSRYSLGNL